MKNLTGSWLRVSDERVRKLMKPQIKKLLEGVLGRKVRFNYSSDRGGDWNQIEVAVGDVQKICEVWSEQSNNVKRGPKEYWSGGTGDLLYKDDEGQYVVSIINANNESGRFAFEYLKLIKE